MEDVFQSQLNSEQPEGKEAHLFFLISWYKKKDIYGRKRPSPSIVPQPPNHYLSRLDSWL